MASSSIKKQMAVVAIDFGTTYSGFAFKLNYAKDAGIHTKTWGEELGLRTNKTPTCLLLNPDTSFNSFGYEAQENYATLSNPKSHYYFDKFKMELHYEGKKQVLDRSMILEDINWRTLPAIDVFAHSIRYLKDEAVKCISNTVPGVTYSNIQWVITVPAIWQSSSKQFMRDAAYQAELVPDTDPERLIIALEPEAASLYCRQLKMFEFLEEKGVESCADTIAKAGTSYMVVDCGDRAAHKSAALAKSKDDSGGPYKPIIRRFNSVLWFILFLSEVLILQTAEKPPSKLKKIVCRVTTRK